MKQSVPIFVYVTIVFIFSRHSQIKIMFACDKKGKWREGGREGGEWRAGGRGERGGRERGGESGGRRRKM